MLCLNGFELYSRWVPLNYVEKGKGRKKKKKKNSKKEEEKTKKD